jgi:ketosteroid isomerase-like protein
VSEENVELVHRMIAAYNRGDYAAATERLHPDIELVPPGDQPPYRGIDQVREWMEPDAFSRQDTEAREVTVIDHGLLVHQHTAAKGAGSGIELEFDSWSLWSFDDAGLITRVVYFLDRNQALAAAGLSE